MEKSVRVCGERRAERFSRVHPHHRLNRMPLMQVQSPAPYSLARLSLRVPVWVVARPFPAAYPMGTTLAAGTCDLR
jgi:hypothetical protein